MISTKRFNGILAAAFTMVLVTACNGPASTPGATVSVGNPAAALPDTSQADPQNPPVGSQEPSNPSTPSTPAQPAYTTAVLLFNGTGVSTSDWQTTEQIVRDEGLSYKLVNSAQLNAMTLDEIASFGVMIVPGGYGNQITSALTTDTRIRVRQAVRDRGMGYVGFCAGAWVAVGSEANTNTTASYGMAVAKGNILDYFWPGGNSSLTAAMVDVSFADGSSRNLVWWGGPATPEWTNGVVARYDNGVPAISETFSGKGYVVISGPHPEAPQSWRSTAGNDSDGLDYDIALAMIHAALEKSPLPAY